MRDEDKRAAIAAAYCDGETPSAVGRRFGGMSSASVRWWLSECEYELVRCTCRGQEAERAARCARRDEERRFRKDVWRARKAMRALIERDQPRVSQKSVVFVLTTTSGGDALSPVGVYSCLRDAKAAAQWIEDERKPGPLRWQRHHEDNRAWRAIRGEHRPQYRITKLELER